MAPERRRSRWRLNNLIISNAAATGRARDTTSENLLNSQNEFHTLSGDSLALMQQYISYSTPGNTLEQLSDVHINQAEAIPANTYLMPLQNPSDGMQAYPNSPTFQERREEALLGTDLAVPQVAASQQPGPTVGPARTGFPYASFNRPPRVQEENQERYFPTLTCLISGHSLRRRNGVTVIKPAESSRPEEHPGRIIQ